MPPTKPTVVSKGAGITAGLEIWSIPTGNNKQAKFVLVDKSPDGRFADDVSQWNVVLNATALKKLKDATK